MNLNLNAINAMSPQAGRNQQLDTILEKLGKFCKEN
jgi:hypothetical protein